MTAINWPNRNTYKRASNCTQKRLKQSRNGANRMPGVSRALLAQAVRRLVQAVNLGESEHNSRRVGNAPKTNSGTPKGSPSSNALK